MTTPVIPKTIIPKTAVPKTIIPKTAVSKTAVSKTAVPKTAVPKTAVPKTALPKITFDAAIYRYYRLKDEYDSAIQKEVKKLANNELLSSKEKHEKFIGLKKKCVSCGKGNGTIFKQEGNILIAECGNIDNPCKLNIRLQRAKYEGIAKDVNNLSDIVNTKKIEIIHTKLNFLFGFENQTTTISTFNVFKTELVDEVKKYQKLTEQYISIIENLPNKEKIKQLNDALFISIQNFKDLIKNYDESGTDQFLKDAMQLYVTEISKTISEIQKLKYIIQYIYFQDEQAHLVQDHYTPAQRQVIVPGIENKILAFTV